jgi:DNA-binding NarL/FixJ family response regulator
VWGNHPTGSGKRRTFTRRARGERLPPMHGEGGDLTPRLLDVLHLVAEGRTTDEIAATLGLSPFTVKNYMERIFERLGARDRAEAVAIALRSGQLK